MGWMIQGYKSWCGQDFLHPSRPGAHPVSYAMGTRLYHALLFVEYIWAVGWILYIQYTEFYAHWLKMSSQLAFCAAKMKRLKLSKSKWEVMEAYRWCLISLFCNFIVFVHIWFFLPSISYCYLCQICSKHRHPFLMWRREWINVKEPLETCDWMP